MTRATIEDDFLKKIEYWRSCVRMKWHETISAYDKVIHPKIPTQLPEYFVDRYSFRVYLHSVFDRGQDRVAVPDYDLLTAYNKWYTSLTQTFSGLPNRDFPPPSLEARIPPSDFRTFLFKTWKEYIQKFPLEVSENYCRYPEGMYWFEYFQNSCHFPKRPALSGPDYFNKLSLKQQEFLIENYGVTGVMDFFIFMQQVHEESHIQQKGEPVLSEFIHAWLWCDFLKQNNLEIFQINDETQLSCNLERSWVTQLEFTKSEMKNFFQDTYLGSLLYFSAPIAYENLCLVAFIFDRKKIKYAEYLETVLKIFLQKDASTWQNSLNQKLTSVVAERFFQNNGRVKKRLNSKALLSFS
ncbi:MAG: hypothetical protein GDA44_04625 [Prochloron sp. SP5CPC1]|nr:hypothetical protein [Candidatus Paraprochloron terpiosi SP5CPC1]